MTPTVATVYENTEYTPVSGTPYQRANLIPATPDNPTIGGNHYMEQGIFQVTLCYPQKVGPGTAQARAEAVRAHFPRALKLTKDTVSLTIGRTPAILPAYVEGDRYCIPVSIEYFAHIN
jgi:hypothetical protein